MDHGCSDHILPRTNNKTQVVTNKYLKQCSSKSFIVDKKLWLTFEHLCCKKNVLLNEYDSCNSYTHTNYICMQINKIK